MLRQQTVAIEVKIPDQRHVYAYCVELVANCRYCRGGLGIIYGNAHDFRAGTRQFRNLAHGGCDIRRIGIGHRLDHDRRAASDRDVGHPHLTTCATRRRTVFGQALHSSISRATLILV